MIYTCIECENLYDDTAFTRPWLCNECIDRIYDEKAAARKKTEVEVLMAKVDEVINWITGGKYAS